jgi:hypothetical protein
MSAERHVRRVPGHVVRPRSVRDTDPLARGLPPGAGAAAAPGARPEYELNGSWHLD